MPTAVCSLIDTAAVAERLSCSEATVRGLVRDRKLIAIRLGRVLRFDVRDVEGYLQSARTTAQTTAEGR
jgi:excisionase family DNA binding protein